MTAFPSHNPDAPDPDPLISPSRLSQYALILALAITIARATLIELVRDPFAVAPGQSYAPTGTGPSTSLLLNLLCLLPPILILLQRALTPDFRLARTRSALIFIALGILATASTLWSSDKFSAIVTGTTFLAAAGLSWSIAQTVRSWSRFRLVTAVFAGLLLVYGAQGLFYRFVELPDLQANVERTKDRILQERGFTPGTFASEQFLRQISSGSMVGFGASPNTYAAALVLLGVVTAGLLVQGLATKRDPILLFALILALAIAVWVGIYARSRTSIATPLIAAALVAAAYTLRRHVLRHRNTLFLAGLLAVTFLFAAIIAHGLYHHSLPSASLNFRWRYWTASYAMVQDHPWLGTGWSNFAASYLPHRLPAAAEEIRDPHNFLVRFATELGLLGLALALAWQLLFWRESTRPILEDSSENPTTTTTVASPQPFQPAGIKSLALICILGMFLNIISSIDLTADAPFVIIELFKRLMFLGALIVGASLALIRSRTDPRPDTTPAYWSLWAAAAAVAVFLIHNLVDFSLFESAPLFLFATLTGALLGLRAPVTGASLPCESGLSRTTPNRDDQLPTPPNNYPVAPETPHAHAGPTEPDASHSPSPPSPATRRRPASTVPPDATPTLTPLPRRRVLPETSRPSRQLAALSCLALTAVGVTYIIFPIKPIISAESKAHAADELLRTSQLPDQPLNTVRVAASAAAYTEAFNQVPFNADYALRAARAWSAAGANLAEVRALQDKAIAADPMAIRPLLDRARLETTLHENADYPLALRLMQKVVALDPTDVPLRLELATLLQHQNQPEEAREQIEKALQYNDLLDPTEPKRLTPDQLEAVNAQLKSLPPSTRPAPTP